MASSTSPAAVPSGPPSRGFWPLLAPYVVPPLAASAAIVPVFRDMVAKSAQQQGLPVLRMSMLEGLREGFRASPTVGIIVGTQMVFQSFCERAMAREPGQAGLPSMLASSAVVGAASAPVLAVFNGQTMGWGVRESLRRFSARQALAITVQETAFVFGLSAADRLAAVMKGRFGDNSVVEYTAAFTAGALGSLAGHPANTALTRWQKGMTVDNWRQSMLGAARKARAVGGFSVVYKLGKETLNATVESPK